MQASPECPQVNGITSELGKRFNLAVDDATRDWIQGVSKAAWQVEKERVTIALSYYGFLILLTRYYVRYCEVEESEPLSSYSRRAISMCFDSACRVIDLVPETPSMLDLMSLPCWWCIVPYIYLAAKVIVDGLEEYASCHLLPRDLDRRSSLAVRWLNTLSDVQRETEDLNNESIYKLSSTVVSTVAVSRPEFSSVRIDQLQTNNQVHGGSTSIRRLSNNAQDLSGFEWSYCSLADKPSTPESIALSKRPHKPPLNRSSTVRNFQEYLGISKESYKIMMVIGFYKSWLFANTI